MRFKIGDKVKVMRRSIPGEIYWNTYMDKAIGKTYIILYITHQGDLRLNTELDTAGQNFLYPPKSVNKTTQLLFDFMYT